MLPPRTLDLLYVLSSRLQRLTIATCVAPGIGLFMLSTLSITTVTASAIKNCTYRKRNFWNTCTSSMALRSPSSFKETLSWNKTFRGIRVPHLSSSSSTKSCKAVGLETLLQPLSIPSYQYRPQLKLQSDPEVPKQTRREHMKQHPVYADMVKRSASAPIARNRPQWNKDHDSSDSVLWCRSYQAVYTTFAVRYQQAYFLMDGPY